MSKLLLALTLCGLAASSGTALADEAPPQPVAAETGRSEKVLEEEHVVTGVIASRIQTSSRAFEAPSVGGSAPGEKRPVITGMVSRSNRGRCVANVTNSGKLSYATSFYIVGTDSEGREQLTRYYFADLKPKESIERSVRCPDELDLSLVLNTARAAR